MATKFYIRGPDLTYTVMPNATYPDLYDNNQTNADIQSGTVSNITKTSLFLADMNLPDKPIFGDAELVGAIGGFYINSITAGEGTNAVGLKAFKLNTPIGNREGGKSSTTGTLVDNEDIVVISGFHKPEYSYLEESFSGSPEDSWVISTQGNTVVLKDETYLTYSDGYQLGQRFGGKSSLFTITAKKGGAAEHHSRFGITDPVLGRIYPIKLGLGMGAWYSVETYPGMLGETAEVWYNWDIEKYDDTAGTSILKYRTKTNMMLNTELSQTLSIKNSFFDSMKEDKSFSGLNSETGELQEMCFGRLKIDTTTTRSEGSSLHFHSSYPHRYNMPGTEVYYPARRSDGLTLDGSVNHQVSWVSKALPLPVHLYSFEPTAAGDGKQPVTPTVEIDINIKEIAPMLIRDQNSNVAEPAHDYRLSRSIVVTFGEEEPRHYDNLMTYIKRHTPNAASDGTGSGTGLGTSAKSFYGLALVKYNGEIGFYNLGNAGKSGSTYTDLTYIIDNSNGEVAFAAAPTVDGASSIPADSWVRLEFQLHPNDEGTYYTFYQPETGAVVSATDPYTGGKIRNVKNITASGTGVWANNLDDFPKYMTIWCNNYQAVKGDFNSTADLWETGCRPTAAGSGSTALKVKGQDSAGDYKNAGLFGADYLLLDRGSDIRLAAADGTSDSDTYVTENPGTITDGVPTLTIASDTWLVTDYVFYPPHSIPDTQISTDRVDCNMSFFIDSVRLKYFNLIHSNATVNKQEMSFGKIEIPKTVKLPATAWQDGSAAVTDVFSTTVQQPSYICLGFDSLSDISTSIGMGETKLMHMNGFNTENAGVTGNIVTSHISAQSNIRVGYTSSVEDYGRQGAANSLQGTGATIHPDIGNGASPVMDNDAGTPTYALRGLKVGDLDSAGREFSVEADGSGSDGVGNVDYFTQKGLMKFIAALRSVDSGDETSNDGNAVVAEGASTFKVGDASNFPVNGYIKIEDEIMKVTIANTDTEVLTVTRGVEGTDDTVHPDATTIFHVSLPEKRECIFASARIIGLGDRFTMKVDDPSIFTNRDNEDYIIYKYDDSHASPTGITGWTFKVDKRDGDMITFTETHNLTIRDSDNYYFGKYLISPRKYWLIIEVLNMSGAHGWQDDTLGTTKYLPAKSYKNLVGIGEKGSYGATFNESLYNDGQNINAWDLDIFNNNQDGLISLKDYGMGEFDEEALTGGHMGYSALSIINDDNAYKEINFNDVIIEDDMEPGSTLPILLTTTTPTDNLKINIETEAAAYNKPYLTAVFDDELPTVEDFKAVPSEDNPFNIDFTWSTEDSDLWYGFIMYDDKHIHNQYQNAVLHYPMNEAGDVSPKLNLHNNGAKAIAPIDKIQGMNTEVDAAASTGPFYDVEGLAGNCLRNDATGSPAITIGTGSADPLASTGYAVTDEMTINFHFTPDADADGVLSAAQKIFFSTQRFYLELQTDATLKYVQYWDTNSAITLTSSTILPLDGATPTNIMVTFDANLTSGNVKLFVNGKLEDLTGEALTADNTSTTNTGWYFQQEIEHNNNEIFVGNQYVDTNVEFLGRMEELVIYNKCLYPVNPRDGKFTFTKPVKEVNETASATPSKSYTARLFVKDYHNIRGSTATEVACSSPVSIRKAAFRLDNS